MEGFPVQAEALHVRLTQVADEDVGGLEQLLQDGNTLRPAGVERKLLLVAVDKVVQRQVAVLYSHGVLAEVAGLVVTNEGLDTDNVSAVLGQYLGTGGAGNEAGHVYDFHSLEKFEFCHAL